MALELTAWRFGQRRSWRKAARAATWRASQGPGGEDGLGHGGGTDGLELESDAVAPEGMTHGLGRSAGEAKAERRRAPMTSTGTARAELGQRPKGDASGRQAIAGELGCRRAAGYYCWRAGL